ncbi:MAG TPA: hypothetical protein VL598_06515 [Trinickia sp.]|uniref:Agd3-related carbohydrate deacetylase n=1 Tax=Trinickia sp. TaxID=2571163 RepID=UPI002C504D61|nr:hypothetical protein [Trinickia sp.]HTI17298.1 hypothetical protein [Trinickia sp.]
MPTDAQIDLKVLVLTSEQASTGPELQAVKSILDRVGTPYDVFVYSSTAPLPVLEVGDHAKYQGIILPVSDSQYMNSSSGSTIAQALARYQFKYNVRMASLYAWPGDTGCLDYAGYRDTSASPLNSTLTAAGTTLFPYMQAGTSSTSPLTLANAWTYFVSPSSSLPIGTTVTPVLQAVAADGQTYSLAATCQFNNTQPIAGDSPSREILAFTFDNNPYLIHSMTLSYGVLNWVTRGLFLGNRHVYMDAQIDDVGIPDEIFPYAELDDDKWYDVRTNPWTQTTTNPPGQCPLGNPPGSVSSYTGTTACEYRITGADFDALTTWQSNLNQTSANGAALKLTMAFNGEGFSTAYGGQGYYPITGTDTLTTQVNANKDHYKWITHTYDHELIDNLTAAGVTTELQQNNTVARDFSFQNYATTTLVTPEISGLYYAGALGSMASFGTQSLVSDSSKPTPPVGTAGCPTTQADGTNWPLPSFNTGKYNCVDQRIFEVPRYPTALFYNVSQPQEWVNEYNFFYGANGTDPTRWGYDLTYTQVLDKTSDTLLSYLLTYDLSPLMFHQSNLRAYDGTNSLLSDLVVATLAKYGTYYKGLPIASPYLADTAKLEQQRLVYGTSSVTATLTPGQTITINATRSDGQSIVVPITGITYGTSTETYGGQNMSYLTLLQQSGYTTQITPAPAW